MSRLVQEYLARLGGGKLDRDDRGDVVVASIGVYSGRGNPEFALTGDAASGFVSLVKETLGRECADPPPRALLGSYYGFYVQTPDEVARRLGIPTLLIAYRNVLSEGAGARQKHWRDTGQVEPFLMARAEEHGYRSLLELHRAVRV